MIALNNRWSRVADYHWSAYSGSQGFKQLDRVWECRI